MATQTDSLVIRLTDHHALRVEDKGGSPILEVDTLSHTTRLFGRLLLNGTVITELETIRKTATELVNDDDTLQDDDDLALPVRVNEIWDLEVILLYDSNITADLKIGWSVPAGATMSWAIEGGDTNNQRIRNESQTLNVNGDIVPRQVTLRCVAVIAGTAGNLQLRWAQAVADASDTSVLIHSRIVARRML